MEASPPQNVRQSSTLKHSTALPGFLDDEDDHARVVIVTVQEIA